MPRKKSALKRAKNADTGLAQDERESPKNLNREKAGKEDTRENDDEEVTSESSEEEDEFGDLITDDIEEGIEKVLNVVRADPKKLLDPNLKFFSDPENVSFTKKNKEKPLYLKDYHRMNLLNGETFGAEQDYNTVDGEKPFVVTEREERNQLLSEINSAFETESKDIDQDEFMKKKELVELEPDYERDAVTFPDPQKNQEEFLNVFLDQQAWIPRKNDKVIDLDKIDNEVEEDFDDAVEKFEHAYNFRYEDPNSAEIVSYARSQATFRRTATNSRKRQREKRREEKKEDDKKKQDLIKKKKTEKVNKVFDRLSKIKEAVGDEISNEVITKVFGDSLLRDDFDDADWDNKMAEVFNEQFYDAAEGKPDLGSDNDFMDVAGGNDSESEVEEDDSPQRERSPLTKKEKLKERKSFKKSKNELREKAESLVEANSMRIADEVEEERGRSEDKGEVKFKYREVSPETFGLQTREILLADDKDLNQFIAIKKFAPYRPKDLRLKDKRKYTKSKRLRDWRKEVFKNNKDIEYPLKDTSK
ncbi:uncharacterized protein PRCAT00001834001 [Priceomyces carsonii]|uniref:uncharacterized protein n=1 Tax=Priceomyces carsonii TaxID=28549 RepID=UPI002EDA3B5B|nr:unnamed protein product [Priceomyces carsonii]